MKTKGFVVVASRLPAFYYSAINLMESLRDFIPDAKIAFFTEQRFLDGREKIADYVDFVPNHIRSKLIGIQRSPWDVSFYIDADCEIAHPDIEHVFDQLGHNHMTFVRLEDDPVSMGSFVEKDFEGGTLELCGGVYLYDKSHTLVQAFNKSWKRKFFAQHDGTWWPEGYPKSLARWDQFTLWWLTNKEPQFESLRIGKFEDNYRWNWFTSFGFDSNGKHRLVKQPPVIIHHSSSMDKEVDYG